MDSKFLPESVFKNLESKDIQGDFRIAYFKLVDIAPSARDKVNGDAAKLVEIVDDVPGYYISCSDLKGLRDAMHLFIDQMIDTLEEKSDE